MTTEICPEMRSCESGNLGVLSHIISKSDKYNPCTFGGISFLQSVLGFTVMICCTQHIVTHVTTGLMVTVQPCHSHRIQSSNNRAIITTSPSHQHHLLIAAFTCPQPLHNTAQLHTAAECPLCPKVLNEQEMRLGQRMQRTLQSVTFSLNNRHIQRKLFLLTDIGHSCRLQAIVQKCYCYCNTWKQDIRTQTLLLITASI